MPTLTSKQRRFCDEYLIDLNATQAAIRAGYSVKTARFIANQNLNKPEINKRIQKLMEYRAERIGITQDMIINELSKIGFVNIFDYLDIKDNQIEFFETDCIPTEKLAAVAEIKQNNNGISFKLYDKVKALELLGKHLGMFKDKVEMSANMNNPFEGLTTEELKKFIINE